METQKQLVEMRLFCLGEICRLDLYRFMTAYDSKSQIALLTMKFALSPCSIVVRLISHFAGIVSIVQQR